jgi:glycosyltransferase involved in cell wall biosynthesis
MKILMDARMITPQIHGIARYTVDLIREFARIGHDVSIISHSGDERKIVGEACIKNNIHCPAHFASPFESVALSSIKSFSKYDVVHFPSFALPLLMPKNGVATIHDLIHLEPLGQSALQYRLHKLYFQTVVRRALLKSLRVITVSEWSRQQTAHKLKIPLEKITVVRNGLEASWFENTSESDCEKPYFLCVSNPKPHKNVITLISACRKLWQEGLDFKLALLLGGGKPPSDWGIKSQDVKHFSLYHRLPDDDLKKLFKKAKALVSTSVFEGYNYPAAESLALGTPVILSKGSAHDEMKVDGVTFYGEATDVEKLAQTLKVFLNKKRTACERPATLNEMALSTLNAYQKLV